MLTLILHRGKGHFGYYFAHSITFVTKLDHGVSVTATNMYSNLSIVHGPAEPALWHRTLGNLVDDQADSLGDRPCLIVPWQSVRLSFSQLAERSKLVAKSLLQMSLRHGDCVGIMAGNCHQYIEVFVGAARVGCPLVVLNNTYTPGELINAVRLTCKSPVAVAPLYRKTART